MSTLSFCILDDLEFAYGPVHYSLQNTCLTTRVKEIIYLFENKTDCAGYFDEEFFRNSDEYIDCIVESLELQNYFVKNRYNKYYVIAFSLDYTRFDVFSKDFDKTLIKWREDNENDPITGIITNENYNENPVTTLVKRLGLEN